MATKTITRIKQYAVRGVTVDGVDAESRRVKFTFMTEAPCDNWFVPEKCLCEKENVDLTRFKNGVMPVLFNHNRDVVIGKPDKITIADKKVSAEVIFDSDEESEKIFQKVLSGSLKGVSVGYRRLNTIRVLKGSEYLGKKYDQTIDITDKWEPFEVSIVSCPADPDCGVGRDLEDKEMEIKTTKEENAMDENAMKTAAANAVKAERQRVADILTVCRQFNVSAEDTDKYVKDETCTIDKVRAAILEDMAKKQTPAKVTPGKDAGEKFVERAVDGLALHYGLIGEKEATEGSNEYRNGSLRSIAEDCLIAGGMSERELRHMSADEIFDQMFSGHTRAMGSEQFAMVVDNFANKAMLKGYKEHPTVFQNLVSKGANRDFKTAYKYRLGIDGEPEEMPPESSEFKYQEMKDERVSTAIKTYGKAISFTREIFVNDDMGQIVRAIRAQSAGFRRLQEKMFFNMLENTVTYNTSTKKNQAQTNLVITAKAYDEMRQLMRNQKDAEGKAFIGVYPRFIVASDTYGYQHEVLLVSASDPSQNNPSVPNIMRDKMKLVTSPYVTGGSGKAYYAVADPAEFEGIEFTTLNGVDRPYSRVVVPQAHLGIDYQFWMDWGFNLLDDRAFVKNPGTNIS